jgi:hypothetical protein
MRAAAFVLPIVALLARSVEGQSTRVPESVDSERDEAYRQALEVLYDGDIDGALTRIRGLVSASPEDPLGLYVETLIFCWKIEQGGESTTLDKEFEARIERALAAAQAVLKKKPGDARALLARGAAQGVKSRFHLFRLHRTEAARAAVKMREDLREVVKRQPASKDALFGLGLYDYYADVLPKLVKVVRFLARMPGGDRGRGLALIEKARRGSLLHDREAQIQLYEIYAFYEKKPDRALEEIRSLALCYRDWPLWPLKLAEHLRARMGLYKESADVARGILATGQKGHHSFTGTAVLLARLSLGESLLLDLRASEARKELLPLVEPETRATPAMVGMAHWLLGRSLELRGDPDGAKRHYRSAASGPDKEIRRRAQEALSSPLAAEEVRAWQLIAEARRLREAGHLAESTERFRRAAQQWPRSAEATLRTAEEEIDKGHGDRARAAVARLVQMEAPDPPWIAAWSRLLSARLHDLAGERDAALKVYKQVYDEPYGQDELRQAAREGLDRPFAPGARQQTPKPAAEVSKLVF